MGMPPPPRSTRTGLRPAAVPPTPVPVRHPRPDSVRPSAAAPEPSPTAPGYPPYGYAAPPVGGERAGFGIRLGGYLLDGLLYGLLMAGLRRSRASC